VASDALLVLALVLPWGHDMRMLGILFNLCTYHHTARAVVLLVPLFSPWSWIKGLE
jgi:hypothetical protein